VDDDARRQPFNSPKEMTDELQKLLDRPIVQWLIRVATIAIGTCLGIILFVLLARSYVEDKLHEAVYPTTPTTSVQPTYSWTP